MSIKLYIEMMSVLRYIMEIKALYFINIENAKQGGIVWILFQNRSRWITGGKQNTNIYIILTDSTIQQLTEFMGEKLTQNEKESENYITNAQRK